MQVDRHPVAIRDMQVDRRPVAIRDMQTGAQQDREKSHLGHPSYSSNNGPAPVQFGGPLMHATQVQQPVTRSPRPNVAPHHRHAHQSPDPRDKN
ncbi:hypothetical protein ACOMHN_008932 [Nucella lapillus]